MTKNIFFALSSLAIVGILCNATKSTSTKVDYGILPKTENSNETIMDEGAVGDVKFSILKPELFIEANGNGWVLMKGQSFSDVKPDPIIYREQEFFNVGGVLQLPDARGVFFRGMNEGREVVDTLGDPNTKRIVGIYQPDLLKDHNHSYRKYIDHGWKTKYGGDQKLVIPEDFEVQPTEGVNNSKGGKETRPRNIALYVYIKIKKSINPNK